MDLSQNPTASTTNHQAIRVSIPQPSKFLELPGDPTTKWDVWQREVSDFYYLTEATTGTQLSEAFKKAFLRTSLGSEGRRILYAHCVRDEADTTFSEYVKELKTIFSTAKNPVRAEYEFRRRKQETSESVNDYFTALRTLITDCEYGIGEDHQLAMQLVIGCASKSTQEKLLTEPAIDLQTFLTVMRADEAATETGQIIRSGTAAPVQQVQSQPSYKGGPPRRQKPDVGAPPARFDKVKQQNKQCMGCGSNTHAKIQNPGSKVSGPRKTAKDAVSLIISQRSV